MNKVRITKTLMMGTLLILALALFTQAVFADVVVFDRYETTYTMEGDSLKVHKKLRLMNVGQNPIIPGEIHFKLSKQEGGDVVPAKITGLMVRDHYDQDIDTTSVEGASELDIIFTLWEPLLPTFFYDFQMDYDVEFDPKGLLFYEINIPNEKTTIKIKSQQTEFLLPKRYHVTFAPDAEIKSEEGARVIEWKDTDKLSFEYSFIPLPRMGVPMVNVFWIFLISISVIYLVVRFVKARKAAMDY